MKTQISWLLIRIYTVFHPHNESISIMKSYQDIEGTHYCKTCLKQPLIDLKIDKTKVLMENGCLMMVKSIAECSPWSILQYFRPALSDNQY